MVVQWSVDYQKLGQTTKDNDSSSPMDYPNIWEYVSFFFHVILPKSEPHTSEDYQISQLSSLADYQKC